MLHELEPSKDLEMLRLSPQLRWHAADVLNNHVTKQLDELTSLRQKLDSTERAKYWTHTKTQRVSDGCVSPGTG